MATKRMKMTPQLQVCADAIRIIASCLEPKDAALLTLIGFERFSEYAVLREYVGY